MEVEDISEKEDLRVLVLNQNNPILNMRLKENHILCMTESLHASLWHIAMKLFGIWIFFFLPLAHFQPG